MSIEKEIENLTIEKGNIGKEYEAFSKDTQKKVDSNTAKIENLNNKINSIEVDLGDKVETIHETVIRDYKHEFRKLQNLFYF